MKPKAEQRLLAYKRSKVISNDDFIRINKQSDFIYPFCAVKQLRDIVLRTEFSSSSLLIFLSV